MWLAGGCEVQRSLDGTGVVPAAFTSLSLEVDLMNFSIRSFGPLPISPYPEPVLQMLVDSKALTGSFQAQNLFFHIELVVGREETRLMTGGKTQISDSLICLSKYIETGSYTV